MKVTMLTRNSRIILFFILLLAAFLLFSKLGNQYLWQDEAETALLGINILKYGLPVASDGKEIISQEWGSEFKDSYLWRWTPWLDKYVAAISMAIFQKNTFAARLPFALTGLLNILLLFFAARRLFRDDKIALLSAFLLTVSVPFLLFMRQCRYYSLLSLSNLTLIYFFYGIIRDKKYSVPGFIISAVILFHSNYTAYFTGILSLSIILFVLYFEKKAILKFMLSNIISLIFIIPGIVIYRVLEKGGIERLNSVFSNLTSYETMVRCFIFSYPLAVLFIVYLAVMKFFKKELKLEAGRELVFILIFCIITIGTTIFLPWCFFRYIVHLIPLFMMLTAYMILYLVRSRNPWVFVMLILVCLIHIVQPKMIWNLKNPVTQIPVRHGLVNYFYEITHDYDGPLEQTIEYLDKNAKDSDTVFVSYGDLVVSFYTPLRAFGGQSGIDISKEEPPDWLLLRSFFSFGNGTLARQLKEKNINIVNRWISSGKYRPVNELKIIDTPWENRPDPFWHLYKTLDKPTRFGNITLLKKQ